MRVPDVVGWVVASVLALTGAWYAGAAAMMATAGNTVVGVNAEWVPEPLARAAWTVWPLAFPSSTITVDQPVPGFLEPESGVGLVAQLLGSPARYEPFDGVRENLFPSDEVTGFGLLIQESSPGSVHLLPTGPSALSASSFPGNSAMAAHTVIEVVGLLAMALACGVLAAASLSTRRGRATRPTRVLVGVAGLVLLLAVVAVTFLRWLADRSLLSASDVAGQFTVASPWTLGNLWPALVGLVLLYTAAAARRRAPVAS